MIMIFVLKMYVVSCLVFVSRSISVLEFSKFWVFTVADLCYKNQLAIMIIHYSSSSVIINHYQTFALTVSTLILHH